MLHSEIVGLPHAFVVCSNNLYTHSVIITLTKLQFIFVSLSHNALEGWSHALLSLSYLPSKVATPGRHSVMLSD